MFVWLVKRNRFLTRSRLSNMHLGTPYGSHCGDIETTLHVLRVCPLSNIGYVVL
jgi:hypothetical protein